APGDELALELFYPLDAFDQKAQVIQLLLLRARGKFARHAVDREVVPARGKIHVLGIGLPDHVHTEDFLVEFFCARHVRHFEGDVAHALQSGNHQPNIAQSAAKPIGAKNRRACGAGAKAGLFFSCGKRSGGTPIQMKKSSARSVRVIAGSAPARPAFATFGKTSTASSIRSSTGFAIDPIEKKPLNHFFPGSEILSFGTAGCNLGCRFCQNWSISKARLDEAQSLAASAERVVELARTERVPAIAFTYNDPVIWGEFVIDIS